MTTPARLARLGDLRNQRRIAEKLTPEFREFAREMWKAFPGSRLVEVEPYPADRPARWAKTCDECGRVLLSQRDYDAHIEAHFAALETPAES